MVNFDIKKEIKSIIQGIIYYTVNILLIRSFKLNFFGILCLIFIETLMLEVYLRYVTFHKVNYKKCIKSTLRVAIIIYTFNWLLTYGIWGFIIWFLLYDVYFLWVRRKKLWESAKVIRQQIDGLKEKEIYDDVLKNETKSL